MVAGTEIPFLPILPFQCSFSLSWQLRSEEVTGRGAYLFVQGHFEISSSQVLAEVAHSAAQVQRHVQLQSEYSHTAAPTAGSGVIVPTQGVDSLTPSLEVALVVQSDQKNYPAPIPSDDGYNWRKYGQKQVKGTDYPRSYYKCSHPDCFMKKKVGRSSDGLVTEIVYKGQHNHEPPQQTRRAKESMSSSGKIDGADGKDNDRNTGLHGASAPVGKNDVVTPAKENLGLREDHLAHAPLQTQSTSYAGGNLCEANSSLSRRDHDGRPPSPRQLSGSSDFDDEGDADVVLDERHGIEPLSIEKNMDILMLDSAPTTPKTPRETRVVVHSTNEKDSMDDGYRWRKYGQKIVKGNPNPRSYYKCTHMGCNVRKHVERASNDSNSVITTYEGKHNHDMPAAKNSGIDTPTTLVANTDKKLKTSKSSTVQQSAARRASSAQGTNEMALSSPAKVSGSNQGQIIRSTSSKTGTGSKNQNAFQQPSLDENLISASVSILNFFFFFCGMIYSFIYSFLFHILYYVHSK
ncbi:putative WRKY transcription factor 4 [Nymphaea thermarum]|nr:putative WRKY transcription factor 4 [Nymphaea thermarum]